MLELCLSACTAYMVAPGTRGHALLIPKVCSHSPRKAARARSVHTRVCRDTVALRHRRTRQQLDESSRSRTAIEFLSRVGAALAKCPSVFLVAKVLLVESQ